MWKTVVSLLALCASAAALKCIQCSTKDTDGCMDPMNGTEITRHTVTCANRELCRKITFTERGKSHVTRACAEMPKGDDVGCGWEIRVASKTGSGWDCFCERDQCNNAPAVPIASWLLLVAASVSALV